MTFTARSHYIPPLGTGVVCLFSPAAVAEIDRVGPNTLSLEAPSWPYDTSWMANTAQWILAGSFRIKSMTVLISTILSTNDSPT